jgi:hypothetical protein
MQIYDKDAKPYVKISEAELTLLRADKARLDWLEETATQFEFRFPLNGRSTNNYASGCVLRAVVDSARRATGKS